MTRVGTWNLNVHDGEALARAFGDWLMFTEADAAALDGLPPWYEVDVCKRQKSLAVAWHADTFTRTGTAYRFAHPGLAKVTPARGTYAVLGTDADGRKTALVVEWRINASRPPYRRGEATLRRLLHAIHSRVTRRLVDSLRRRGYVVHVAGDPNLPKHERAYPYLPYEVGRNVAHGLDRIGSTRRLGNVVGAPGPEAGHARLSARVMR